MKNIVIIHLLFVILILNSLIASSQIGITGSTCVVPGTEYQYNISGKLAADSSTQVCISGGTIVGSSSTCVTHLSEGYVRVIWDSTFKASISLISPAGNYTKYISIAPDIAPGNVSDSSKSQIIDYNTIPLTITCSAANGGSCSPSFSYQWQLSMDALDWQDINGSTEQHLFFSSPLVQSTFYRRKTINNKSGTVYYSQLGAVYVNVDMSAHK